MSLHLLLRVVLVLLEILTISQDSYRRNENLHKLQEKARRYRHEFQAKMPLGI